MEYTITSYDKRYYDQCADLIGETWNFNKLFEGITRQNIINMLFLKFSIADSNYSQIIIDGNDRIHGFLFGKINAKPHSGLMTFSQIASALISGWFHFITGHMGNRKVAGDVFKNFINAERELNGKRKKGDAYVSLFIVGPTLRGAGFGKTLLESFEASAEQYDCPRVYLWTDIGCNYGFYEHCGFERVIETYSSVLEGYGERPNAFAYSKPLVLKR